MGGRWRLGYRKQSVGELWSAGKLLVLGLGYYLMNPTSLNFHSAVYL